ncbi:MAG: YidH family protein [Pseudonocardiaceae bacterium]
MSAATSRRRKPPLRDIGSDPDYRFTLANERTFLAWLRTSLGLIAGGVALTTLVPQFGPQPVRVGLAALLLVMALACAAGGYLRWERAERALRTSSSLHFGVLPRLVAIGLAAVVLVALTVIVVEAVG